MRAREVVRLALVGSLAATALSGLGSVVATAQEGPGTPAADNTAPEAGPPPLPPGVSPVAAGLDNPRGLAFGPDGALYVAEAGRAGDGPCVEGPEGDRECYGTTGAVSRIGADGARQRVVEGLRSRAAEDGSQATGPHDVAFQGDALYALVGLGADPGTRVDFDEDAEDRDLGRLVRVDGGARVVVADISGYETTANPDGGDADSNPYSLVALPDGGFAVADAGANALFRVGTDGAISTLAVFPERPVAGPGGQEVPMQAVPNAVAVGADGSFYVGQLTGFPFPPGGANVYRVPAAGGEPEVAAEGFTNIIDVAVDADGTLYVLEFNRGGLINIDPANPATLEGQLTRIAPDGARSILAGPGLVAPTAVTVGPDGALYLSILGTLPGAGQVVRLDPAAVQATPVAATPAASPAAATPSAATPVA